MDRTEFNLCKMNPKYTENLLRLSQQKIIVQANDAEKVCTSYLELIEGKDELILKYDFNWYTYFKNTHKNHKLPFIYGQGGTNHPIAKSETTYTEAKTYWKVIY